MDKYNKFEGLDPQAIHSVLEEHELMRFVGELIETPGRFTQEEQNKVNTLVLNLFNARNKYVMENNNLMLQINMLMDKLDLKDKDIQEIKSVKFDNEMDYFSKILEANNQNLNKLKEELTDKEKQINILLDLLHETKK